MSDSYYPRHASAPIGDIEIAFLGDYIERRMRAALPPPRESEITGTGKRGDPIRIRTFPIGYITTYEPARSIDPSRFVR